MFQWFLKPLNYLLKTIVNYVEGDEMGGTIEATPVMVMDLSAEELNAEQLLLCYMMIISPPVVVEFHLLKFKAAEELAAEEIMAA